MTDAQMEAVLDAQNDREGWGGRPAVDVAADLRSEGHAAWDGGVVEGAHPAGAEPLEGNGGDPLDVGEPQKMVPATAAIADPNAGDGSFLPVKPVDAPEGGETLDATDMAIPWLALAQDQTTVEDYDVPSGTWFLSSDPEGGAETRDVAILEIRKGREFLGPYKKPEEEERLKDEIHRRHGIEIPDETRAWCRSDDRTTPVEQDHGVLSRVCKECPWSVWKRGTGGKRIPPNCGEVYKVLLVDCETGLPARYTVKSTAVKPFKSLNTLLILAARMHKVDGRHAPFSAFKLTLSAKKVIKDGDKFYTPQFGRPQRIEDQEEVDSNRALRRGVLGEPEAKA